MSTDLPKRIKRHPTSISELTVSGFKSIGDPVTMPVLPLTLIAGANSSGKSSFMQAFLMLKQTLEAPFDPGPLLLHGPNVRLTSWGQALSRERSRASGKRDLSIGFALGERRLMNKYEWSQSKGLNLVSTEYVEGKLSGTFNKSMSSSSVAEQLTSGDKRRFRSYAQAILTQMQDDNLTDDEEVEGGDGTGPSVDLEYITLRRQCFLVPSARVSGPGVGTVEVPALYRYRATNYVQALTSIVHVPGLRGNPERVYESSAVGRALAGTADRYVASIIYSWQTGSEADKLRLTSLGGDLKRLGLTWKVEAKQLDDVQVALRVGRMNAAQRGGAHDLVNIADVGFGVSQTLPVLVMLRAASRGQTVYIEQPEIHLHPRAQVELGYLLVEAATRGVRVIAETHSSLIVRAVQTAIARKQIHHDDVGLNWFSRNAETGFSQITSAELDDAGRFGDWPADFDDVAEKADWDYVVSAQGADLDS